MVEPIYNWDAETHTATCVLTIQNKKFSGRAICHEDDLDMESMHTGLFIAEARARIEYLKYLRDDCQAKLQALLDFYFTINNSRHFNTKSYESRMLIRQIKFRQENLEMAKDLLNEERAYLKTYLETKENTYQAFRNLRKSGINPADKIREICDKVEQIADPDNPETGFIYKIKEDKTE